jgi:hypothetical protein
MQHFWRSFPRQDERYGVQLQALVHLPDGSQVAAQVKNISSYGCQLAIDHQFTIGEQVVVEVARWQRQNAEIRWVRGGYCGVRYR